MHKEFLMGNEAIALGALAAGVNLGGISRDAVYGSAGDDR